MKRWGILLPAAALLAGCQDERIIEKVGFIRTIAFEAAEGDDLKVTISLPKSDEKSAIYYSAIARTPRQARKAFDRQNDRKLVNGQLRQALFGVGLARRGVWPEVQNMLRDPSIGNRVHLLVVEGSGLDLLKDNYPQGPTAGDYIDRLIDTGTKSREIPEMNVNTFARDYYDDGIEPTMAVLSRNSQGLIIDGIALFREDKYVGKIGAEDTTFFSLLHGRVRSSDLYLDYPGKDFSSQVTTLQFMTSKRKVAVKWIGQAGKGGRLHAVIRLKLSGSVQEYRGDLHPEKLEDARKLEAEMSRRVQEKCEETIRQLQRLRSDAIGIGMHVRNAMPYKQWKALDWGEEFARADIEVQAEVKMNNFGDLQS